MCREDVILTVSVYFGSVHGRIIDEAGRPPHVVHVEGHAAAADVLVVLSQGVSDLMDIVLHFVQIVLDHNVGVA
jgi:hypothetical protein